MITQGTGGVSIFTLLLAAANRTTKAIITSSSDEKLAAIKEKFSTSTFKVEGYNYRTYPDQADEVKRLTDGKGVDMVVNNVGPGSLPADLDSLKPQKGVITLVGFLGGLSGDWEPSALLAAI